MADIATTEPLEARAGDTWQWRREDLTDWPASSWTLSYAFKSDASAFAVSAVADGANYSVTVAKATTAGLAAGTYLWVAVVTSATERHQVGTGSLSVLPDFHADTDATWDTRSHARRVLDSIEAVIEGRATLDQQKMEIAGRSLERMPVADLLKFRDAYKAEVLSEQRKAAVAAGRGSGAKMLARL